MYRTKTNTIIPATNMLCINRTNVNHRTNIMFAKYITKLENPPHPHSGGSTGVSTNFSDFLLKRQ